MISTEDICNAHGAFSLRIFVMHLVHILTEVVCNALGVYIHCGYL